jgi:RHS repeat-associated protein
VVRSTTTHYVGPWYEFNPTTQVATLYCPCNGKPVAMKEGTTVTYLHHDQLGSLVSATNAAWQEVFSARYWPFTSLRTSTGTLPTDRLFAGQTRDLGSHAFYFFPARYLDTTIGKFHTPDTVVPDAGNPQALNRYSYVLNRLLTLTDPTGHMYADPGYSSDGSPGDPTGTVPPNQTPADTGTSSPPDPGFAPNGTPPNDVSGNPPNPDTIGPPSPDTIGPAPGPAPSSAPAAPPTPSIEALGESVHTVGGLLEGNPAEAVLGLTGLAGVAGDSTYMQVAGAVGYFYSYYYAATTPLMKTGEGLSGIFAAQGLTKALPALAGASAFVGRAVPVVAGALGVTQGVVAINDLRVAYLTGHLDRGRVAKDALQVVAGALGGAAIVVVVTATAPEDAAIVGAVGLLTLGGAIVGAAATAAGQLL